MPASAPTPIHSRRAVPASPTPPWPAPRVGGRRRSPDAPPLALHPGGEAGASVWLDRVRLERARPDLVFRWLTRAKALWAAALLATEGVLLGAVAASGAGQGGTAAAAMAILVAAHLLAVGAFVAGGHGELRLRLHSRVLARAGRWRARRGSPHRGGVAAGGGPVADGGAPADGPAADGPAADGPAVGDPSLAGAVTRLSPSHPRLGWVDAPATLARWQLRAGGAVRALYGLDAGTAARLDDTPPLTRLATVELGHGLRRVAVVVRAPDGTPIPGYLFEHAGAPAAAPRPAVLVAPGHGPGIAGTAGLVPSIERGGALAIARAGYVVLTLELRGFGELGERIGLAHETVATNAVLAGSFYAAVLARDLLAGLAALRQEPSVDPTRLAVTGCSLGGNLALTVAALDPQVRVTVAQGLVDWPDLAGRRPPVVGHAHGPLADRCWVVPGENARTWCEDRFLLVAPRPFLIVNARGDVGDMAARGNWLVDRLRQAYRGCGAAERFGFRVEPGAHQYFTGVALDFLARHL